jgi:hypothetical protein
MGGTGGPTGGNVIISARAHIEKLERHVQFKFWQRSG